MRLTEVRVTFLTSKVKYVYWEFAQSFNSSLHRVSMPIKLEKEAALERDLTKEDSASSSRRIPIEPSNSAMTSVGTLEPFDISHPENWSTYYARFELFLQANDIRTAERQRAIFLTLAGAPLYDLLSSLASPKKRDQMPNETFAEYIAALRKLAVDCNFGGALDRMLRDRLVCGLRDESLQRNLLAESDLQLQKVIERATTAEAASKNVQVIRQPEQVNQVGKRNQPKFNEKFKSSNNTASAKPCNGCGGAHARSQCSHRETICSACGVKGHLQRVCRSVNAGATKEHTKATDKNRQQGGKSKPQSINQILSSRSRKKSTTIYINQKPCKFEVDSGSDYTIVSSKTFDQLWPGVKPLLYECGLELRDFQHNGVPIRGVLDVDIEYNKRSIKDLPLIIVNGNQSNVLGCNWFDSLGISVQGVLAIEESPTIKHILGKFEHLFSKELGKFRGEPVSLQVKDNIQPIRLPARRIPIAIRSLVETELDRLCAQGIFEPVEYSDWATPIVPVLKSDGTIRICGDYKSTLNKAMLPHNFQIPSISSIISSIEGVKIFAKLDLAQAYQQLAVDEDSAMLQTVVTHKGAFKIRLKDERLIKRHLDQIRNRSPVDAGITSSSNENSTSMEPTSSGDSTENDSEAETVSPPSETTQTKTSLSSHQSPTSPADTTPDRIVLPSSPQPPTPRRSKRPRKIPAFYSPSGR
ncbi:PREDICTED: uncharacterized protein LOC108363521 [Rhagoletis zephyria]|uniref:uncharacterized protein LOC108363521 n=1 Tax=Rhagoletis zephyria TaxID=28612 RepID=UPI00081195BE|nr:PREDICTED: uncharacterized protein LOC108363521 [Rhagoletis zephyria]